MASTHVVGLPPMLPPSGHGKVEDLMLAVKGAGATSFAGSGYFRGRSVHSALSAMVCTG